MRGKYTTIADVRFANKARGHYFFHRDTMKDFCTIIETGVWYGKYFVYSDRREENVPRVYKIGRCEGDGSVTIISSYPGHPSKDSAVAAMKELIQEEKDAERANSND